MSGISRMFPHMVVLGLLLWAGLSAAAAPARSPGACLADSRALDRAIERFEAAHDTVEALPGFPARAEGSVLLSAEAWSTLGLSGAPRCSVVVGDGRSRADCGCEGGGR